ncbi:hypothetical protein CHU_2963 [Cytophaga hutchinsonii ATCC 33406]|uniref:Uncharacterized protein n=1 Tax=Cytophaga hutchinsonii (strain ATCC 33406 / DSM 1761 / CIP 103989 / NBRC 15051 / NCIMB 9469 / D465) TaxID=269798 RepID=A0A6N4SUY9_CYTH3|nr:hypothetical protein CHU_2963 [Cytophaga hutchinsonii ATCC 33406]
MNIQEFTCSEEWKAYEIWLSIKNHHKIINGYTTVKLSLEFLNDLNFEILDKNDMACKNHLITISLSRPIDMELLHTYLVILGVNKMFIDRSYENYKTYLSVWV